MVIRRKYHRLGFTAAQSAELWERWKKGEGLHAIWSRAGQTAFLHFQSSEAQRRDKGAIAVSADGKSVGELARSLHTRTMFSVDRATIFRFHLDKAIKTRGKVYDGQTALQLLTGQMDTQNTDEGLRVTFTGGKARAGIYTSTGGGTVYKRRIDANGLMYLIVGAIGVPFTVRGSVENPTVSVPRGFLAGAAIGTVMICLVSAQ